MSTRLNEEERVTSHRVYQVKHRGQYGMAAPCDLRDVGLEDMKAGNLALELRFMLARSFA